MLLSLAVVLSIAPPITAAAADDGIMTVGTGATAADPYELPEEAFLWEKSGEKTTLIGVSPTWYKTHVEDRNIEYVSVKIPATTVKIDRCFAGAYGSSNSGYNSAGTQENSTNISGELVAVDFSQATELKTIDVQAFGFVSNLTGVIDLSNTQVEVIEGNAFKKTAISGVILPDSLKSIGGNPSSPGSHAPVFGECKNLEYIRLASSASNKIIELPSGLETIKSGGLYLEETKIEQTMKTSPFVITIRCRVQRFVLVIIQQVLTRSMLLKEQISLTLIMIRTVYSKKAGKAAGDLLGLPARMPMIALSRNILTAASFTAIPPMSLT